MTPEQKGAREALDQAYAAVDAALAERGRWGAGRQLTVAQAYDRVAVAWGRVYANEPSSTDPVLLKAVDAAVMLANADARRWRDMYETAAGR